MRVIEQFRRCDRLLRMATGKTCLETQYASFQSLTEYLCGYPLINLSKHKHFLVEKTYFLKQLISFLAAFLEITDVSAVPHKKLLRAYKVA